MASSPCPVQAVRSESGISDSDKKRHRSREISDGDDSTVSPDQEQNQESRRVKIRIGSPYDQLDPNSCDEDDDDDDDDDEQLHIKEKLQEDRKSSHMYGCRDLLLSVLGRNQVVIIVGETGCEKTTQIPQYLYEAGYGKKGRIGCTQPHGFAARSAAARVSQEMGVKLGQDVVGYSIPFEECTSENTVLRYMSDATLLHELYGEPDLISYSVLMVDDAQQRTLSTDILVGFLKDILRSRTNLKLVISTATRDCANKFLEFFDHAPPILDTRRVKQTMDVEHVSYLYGTHLDAAISYTLDLHQREPSGDILVFLNDREEIEEAAERLQQREAAAEQLQQQQEEEVAEQLEQREEEAVQLQQVPLQLSICPFYENMSPEFEANFLETTPQGARKVVLATSIAETYWPTKARFDYVVDSGFCRTKYYDPRTEMESFKVTSLSKASTMLRANHQIFGKCHRLSPERNRLPEVQLSLHDRLPEVQCSNLVNVVLTLRHLGVSDLTQFYFLDPPEAEALSKALELLFALGALQNKGQVTEVGELTVVGERMAQFPLDAMLSKAIVASDQYKCSVEVISIVAMLSAADQYGSVFYCPEDRQVDAANAQMRFHAGNVGDHIALLKIYNEWKHSNYSDQWCHANFIQIRIMKRARDIRNQLERLLEKVGIEFSSNPLGIEPIKKAILSGFFPHCAKLHHGSYIRVKPSPRTLHIHSSSGLAIAGVFPRWVVYHELAADANHEDMDVEPKYMRQVSEISPEWLLDIAPQYYRREDTLEHCQCRCIPQR